MKKLRYNIDDLMEQIRQSGVDSLSKVEFAVLESNGQLSVIQKNDEITIIPFPIIKDGKIDEKTMKILNKDRKWLIEKLNEKGYENEKQIFMCFLEKDEGLFCVEKNYISKV